MHSTLLVRPVLWIVVGLLAVIGSVYFLRDHTTGPSVGIAEPALRVERTDSKTVLIAWDNLSPETVALRVYRSPDGDAWELWQTFAASGSGSVSLTVLESGLQEYRYYAEGVSSSGDITWTSTPVAGGGSSTTSSSENSATEENLVVPPSSSSSAGENQPNSSTATLPYAATSTAPQAVVEPPPVPPATPPVSPPPSLSPQQQEPFWVQHVNKKIEVGWRDLPSGTNRLVLYRGQSEGGPWVRLLEQGNVTASSGFMRFVDFTLYDPYYYRLEAFDGTVLRKTYGPLLLQGLDE